MLLKSFIRLCYFFVGISFLPLLSGCWDRAEINDIAIVMGSAFDKVGEEYEVTMISPLPGEMGGPSGGGGGTSGGATYYLDAALGRSIRDASMNLQRRMSRELKLGHRRILLIGEELAKEGVRKPLDVLSRHRESRITTQVFITEGSAKDVLSAQPQLENISAEAIRELGGRSYNIMLRDFLLEFQQKGNDPILPVVKTTENRSPIKENVAEQVEISKLAIFKGDKLHFFTNKEETAGVDWLLSIMEGHEYTFVVNEEKKETFTVFIKEANCTIDYDLNDEEPFFKIDIKTSGIGVENVSDINLEERGGYEKLNELMNEQIKQEVTSIIDHTLSEGIDSFGFGWHLHRRERKIWKELEQHWQEKLPNIDYEITINSSVELPGLVTEGVGIGE
ncbi:Ger(x)C family spore germination protein [Evansella cellulosilytica]|uniref:Germination protein, Ger(X)C family n=1 Tax=Evansella cellulosilytica (strain ATCC 21833 / DSM 2522 / FERM P-1141 / JCM 9156 / N-4) TaxID=649639 RepID=E6U0Z5_EVAC2|nr:Ger(x)C family spore germination protein [Evansella cellulosilytica]ADU30307.1 germination protein, Ger(x)C family [Evansella cellulosilytica DSM 2522]